MRNIVWRFFFWWFYQITHKTVRDVKILNSCVLIHWFLNTIKNAIQFEYARKINFRLRYLRNDLLFKKSHLLYQARDKLKWVFKKKTALGGVTRDIYRIERKSRSLFAWKDFRMLFYIPNNTYESNEVEKKNVTKETHTTTNGEATQKRK